MPKVEGINPANYTNYPFLSIHKTVGSFDKNVINKDDVLQVRHKNKLYKVFVSSVTDDTIYLYNNYGEDYCYHTITTEDMIINNVEIVTNLLTGPLKSTCLKTKYRWHVNKDWFNSTQFYLVHMAYLNVRGDCRWVTELGKFDFEHSKEEILIFKNTTTGQSFEVDLTKVYDIAIQPVEYFQMPPSLDTGGLQTVLNDIELEENV